MRIIGHGLGPGFCTTATRRSVTRRADGLELVFTFRWGACSAAASRDRSAPPRIPAEVLNRSRRPILPLPFHIAVFSSQLAGVTRRSSANHSVTWRLSQGSSGKAEETALLLLSVSGAPNALA